MTSDSSGDRKHRLDAIEGNVKWLREHDLDEDTIEAAKRLGLIKGDMQALIWSLDDTRYDDD